MRGGLGPIINVVQEHDVVEEIPALDVAQVDKTI